MNTSTEYTRRELEVIAGQIRLQIGARALMAQGARGFVYGNFTLQGYPKAPGFRFTAKPSTRLVDVYVLLMPSDTYTVVARKRNVHEPVTLLERTDVHAADLQELILFLDREMAA